MYMHGLPLRKITATVGNAAEISTAFAVFIFC